MGRPKRNWWRLLRDGVATAMFFLPLYPIYELAPQEVPVGILLTPLLSGLLSLGALWGEDQGETILKWGISLPLTVGWFLWMRQTSFFVRLVNWTTPGYGRLSGGAGFALTVSLGLLGMAHIMALGGALGLSGGLNEKAQKTRRILQGAVLPLIALAVLLAMIYLQIVMPTWEEIYHSVYG